MVFGCRLLVALAFTGFLAAPLHADVIPTQYSGKSDAKDKVEARLTDLGVQAQDARQRAVRLTEEEASYFARHDERIQIVGQELWAGQADMLWWEWLFGSVALGGVIAGLWIISNDD